MQSYNVFTIKLQKEKTVELDIDNKPVTSTEQAAEIIKLVADINDASVEKFGLICLNIKGYVVGVHILAVGNLNTVSVKPRELFQPAIANNADNMILFHNHPSGDPTPSNEDIKITRRFVKEGALMEISVLDHIIVAFDKHYSMATQNDINFNIRYNEYTENFD